MSKPLITVLIDTYNHEPYIEQAVVSAVEQDFPSADYEILVVDDGSTDRTAEILRKFAPRVRLLQKKNGGQASAFNAGIRESRGEIIAFLDGDDWFAAGKLTAVANALEKNPQAAAVGHGFYEFDEETKGARAKTPPGPKFVDFATLESTREAGAAWPFLCMGALTVRRRTVERAIPIPETLVFCADTPLSLASMAGGAFILDAALFYYRHHESNLYSGACGAARLRRKRRVHELALERSFDLLLDLGVRSELARAIACPVWTTDNRLLLSILRGNRLKTLRTEMRSFHLDLRKPNLGRRVFERLLAAAAALVLPPARFYSMRDEYTRRRSGSDHNWICGQFRKEDGK